MWPFSLKDIPRTPISQEKFQKYLGRFLFSRIGSKYRLYFQAESNLTCGDRRVSPITVRIIDFTLKPKSKSVFHASKLINFFKF
jgi:hypothetical protein